MYLDSLHHPPVATVLAQLYAATVACDGMARQRAAEQGIADEHHPDFYHAMQTACMPVTPELGKLLYLLVRLRRPACVVEYGTSFGVAALHLAAALHDNGAGRLQTYELHPGKAQQARRNLADAGLAQVADCHCGEARTLLAAQAPDAIDMLLLDGAKQDYLPLLRLLEPRLRPGALVIADNSAMAGARDFVDYISDPAHGYAHAAILTEALGSHHPLHILLRMAPPGDFT